MRFVKGLCFLSLLVSSSAFSGIILNGTNSVGVLSLGESFVSFYDRGGSMPASSNTGFELDDNLVLFVAEHLGEFALFGLIDTTDNTGGTADLTLTDSSLSIGELLFVDDLGETMTTIGNSTTISYVWNQGRNDGFIYTFSDSAGLDLSVILGANSGITNVTFLQFTDGLVSDSLNIGSSLNLTSTESSLMADSPSGISVMLLALISLAFFNRRKINR